MYLTVRRLVLVQADRDIPALIAYHQGEIMVIIDFIKPEVITICKNRYGPFCHSRVSVNYLYTIIIKYEKKSER